MAIQTVLASLQTFIRTLYVSHIRTLETKLIVGSEESLIAVFPSFDFELPTCKYLAVDAAPLADLDPTPRPEATKAG